MPTRVRKMSADFREKEPFVEVKVEMVEYFPSRGSCAEFVDKFLLPNRPCLFGEWLTEEWGARRLWVNEDGTPNLKYLSDKYGKEKVGVANCRQWIHSSHPKTDMTMNEFLEYWRSTGDCDRGATPTSMTTPTSTGPGLHTPSWCDHLANKEEKLLYLKDWHLFKQHPEESNDVYLLPEYFACDWLNEVWVWRDDVIDDYKFVYMGPTGTWTPFHADVLRSYSWSANICGIKEWILYEPGQELLLQDRWGNLPNDVTSHTLQDTSKYPTAAAATPPIVVVQGPGQVIFVPSGWHHQVRNLGATISINHNWCNSFNIPRMCSHLQHELSLVETELQDCVDMEDWKQHCQVVLKACTGMDQGEFRQLHAIILLPRLHHFYQLLQLIPADRPCLKDALSQYFNPLVKFVCEVTETLNLSFFSSGCLPPKLQELLTSLKSAAKSCMPRPLNMVECYDTKFTESLSRLEISSTGADTRLCSNTVFTSRKSGIDDPDLKSCTLDLPTSIPYESGTVGPVSSESDMVGPLSSKSDTVGPVSSKSGTVGPVSSESGTVGPVSSESGTVDPVSNESITAGPVSNEFGTIGLGNVSSESGTVRHWNITDVLTNLVALLPRCLQECVRAIPVGEKQFTYKRLLALRSYELWTLHTIIQEIAPQAQ